MKTYPIESERIQRLRNKLLDTTPGVDTDRAYYYTEGYKLYEGYPLPIQRARAIEHVLKNMTLFLDDDALLLGNHASRERCAPIFPEYGVEWLKEEFADKGNFDKRSGDCFHLDLSETERLNEIVDFWLNKGLKDRCVAIMPQFIKDYSTVKVVHGEGNMSSGDGHIVPDFEKALKIGLEGVIKEAQDSLEHLNLVTPGALSKKSFLEACMIINQAVIDFGQRLKTFALDQALITTSSIHKQELIEMASLFDVIPQKPANTFYEAIQMTWLIHLVIQIESNGHSASLGRVDQYLYPYYQKDVLDDKSLTVFKAKELLQYLWVKLYSVLKIRPTAHAGYGAGYPTYQNVTIGGCDSQLNDVTNELSYLILESVAETKLTQPNLSARMHQNTDSSFIVACANVVATGFGMPAIHCDEIIIKSLLLKHVTVEDAYNYTFVGCVEVAVPGKWGYRTTGMSFLNMPKVLELTMNDGFDPRTGIQLYQTPFGVFNNQSTYQDLLDAFELNMIEYTKATVLVDQIADTMLEFYPDVFCSSLTDSCIERGLTIKEGGAKYDYVAGLQVGLANVSNALQAIKEVVYEQKKITQEELMIALSDNFKSLESRRIQKWLLAAHKYGNDEDDVDQIAVDVYALYEREISKYVTTRYNKGPIGGTYSMSTSAISSNVPMGAVILASPDGREAYKPVAEGASPTQGTDTNGPTAVLKSIVKLPTHLMVGGQLLNQKFTPSLIQDEVGFERFVDLIKATIALNVWHIQFNIVNRETLLEAKIYPDKYRDIIVRVAGYCAQFVNLDPMTQDDIISRSEQRL